MHRTSWWAALIAVLACAQVTPAATWKQLDILGRPIPNGPGRPTIVVYANRATGDPIQHALADISARLSGMRPLVVVRVDLRDLPELFKGYAASRIQRRYEEGIRLYERECQRLGFDPNPRPQDSLYFVSDAEGGPHESVGLKPGFSEALAIAYDASGNELLRAPFPRGAEEIEQTVREAGR